MAGVVLGAIFKMAPIDNGISYIFIFNHHIEANVASIYFQGS